MSKQIEVVVAPRKSIHLNGSQIGLGKDAPGQVFGPGSKVLVDESEVERLVKQGFIIDPQAKGITAADIAAADASAYLPGANDARPVSISEKSDQSIRAAKSR